MAKALAAQAPVKKGRAPRNQMGEAYDASMGIAAAHNAQKPAARARGFTHGSLQTSGFKGEDQIERETGRDKAKPAMAAGRTTTRLPRVSKGQSPEPKRTFGSSSPTTKLPKVSKSQGREMKRAFSSSSPYESTPSSPPATAVPKKKKSVSFALAEHDDVQDEAPLETVEAAEKEMSPDDAQSERYRVWSDFSSESEEDPDPELEAREAAKAALREPTPLVSSSLSTPPLNFESHIIANHVNPFSLTSPLVSRTLVSHSTSTTKSNWQSS